MKERPIIFSAPGVRAILAGRKTMTRRACKDAFVIDAAESFCEQTLSTTAVRLGPAQIGRKVIGHICKVNDGIRLDDLVPALCPYGQPGDRLWVRETFLHEPADYCWEASVSIPVRPAMTIYRADADPTGVGTAGWKSPIHMPRSLSRITLEIESVRVERLQDISEADAMAEGCQCYVCGAPLDGNSEADCHCFHRTATASDYRDLWEHINGPDSWEKNPFVWVILFRRVG